MPRMICRPTSEPTALAALFYHGFAGRLPVRTAPAEHAAQHIAEHRARRRRRGRLRRRRGRRLFRGAP
jgi:hypothetical protein